MKDYLIIKTVGEIVIALSESDNLEELVKEFQSLMIPFNEYYYIIESKDLDKKFFSCLYSRVNQFYKNTKE